MRSRLLQFSFLLAALLLTGNVFATGFSISVSPNDTICHGTSVTFTAGTTGAYGYIWKVNGIPAPSITSTFTTTTLNNNDSVKCLLTNVAGDTIWSTSNVIVMTVDSLPAITPILGLDSLCVNATLQLYDSTHGGTWASSNNMYATISATGLVTGLVPTPNFGPNQLRMMYIMSNNCGSDTVRFRVRVHQPAGPIMLTGNNPVCLDSFIYIRDTARGGLWSFSDNTIANTSGPGGQVQAFAVGTTDIYYNLTNACGSMADTLTLNVINCDTFATSVKTVKNKDAFVSIFPNPNTGIFNITLGTQYTTAHCVITNMLGHVVKQTTLNTGSNNLIDMKDVAGIYFITVTTADQRYTSKLIVQ